MWVLMNISEDTGELNYVKQTVLSNKSAATIGYGVEIWTGKADHVSIHFTMIFFLILDFQIYE